jgi:hypothetical protein
MNATTLTPPAQLTRNMDWKKSCFLRLIQGVETSWTLKSTIFWDITLCSLLSIYRRFGGTYRLHLQGRKISLARWRRHIPPKRRFTLNGLHGVISQKIELFITTAVRTSNSTKLNLVWGWIARRKGLRRQVSLGSGVTRDNRNTIWRVILELLIYMLEEGDTYLGSLQRFRTGDLEDKLTLTPWDRVLDILH